MQSYYEGMYLATIPNYNNSFSNFELDQIMQINNFLRSIWLFHKIGIYYHPDSLNQYITNGVIDSQCVKKYKSDILNCWDKPLDMSEIRMRYELNAIQPLLDHIQTDSYIFYHDIDSLITFEDIDKACYQVGLERITYRKWCDEYDEHYKWLPAVHVAKNNMFSIEYANNLKNRLAIWRKIERF